MDQEMIVLILSSCMTLIAIFVSAFSVCQTIRLRRAEKLIIDELHRRIRDNMELHEAIKETSAAFDFVDLKATKNDIKIIGDQMHNIVSLNPKLKQIENYIEQADDQDIERYYERVANNIISEDTFLRRFLNHSRPRSHSVL